MKTVPCMAAFMSSLTIITVAVDRHRVITRSHKKQVKQNILAYRYLNCTIIL